MRYYHRAPAHQGQKDFTIILAKIRDIAIFNRLYIKFVANNGKNRDSVHAAISFCPCSTLTHILVISLPINLRDIPNSSRPCIVRFSLSVRLYVRLYVRLWVYHIILSRSFLQS